MTPFIVFPEEYDPIHRDVQIVTRNGRVAQPPPIDRPFAGTNARNDVQREDDEIFMMEWDREAPQPISLYEDSYFSGYIHGQQVPKPFRLIPDEVPRQIAVSLVCLQYVLPMTPFILFPEEYGPIHRDVQIVTRSGNVA